MREIGAPDAAITEFGDELARERHRVGIGRTLARGAVAAAHLYPHFGIFHQLEQIAERLLLQPVRCVDAPHVVDDHGYRRTPQRRREFADAVSRHMDL